MKFLTTSAIALMLAAPAAFADSHSSSMGNDDSMHMGDMDSAMLIRTRDITGGEIYTMNAANDEGWNPDYMFEEVNSEWNQVGTIEDIVLSHSGQVVGIIAEVGGFLDIGDQHVMLEVDDLNLVAIDDTRYTYVTRFSEEQLEEMEGVDEGFWN